MLRFASCIAACLLIGTVHAKTIHVGPGKQFKRLSQAMSVVRNNDTILIDPRTNLSGDTCQIRANNVTIRGLARDRLARFVAPRSIPNRKAIFVVSGNDVTIENIEFTGARVRDKNGAGIRAEGRNLTVRNCRFHNCENGILATPAPGRGGVVTIEHCEFSHCGLDGLSHNLYINNADKLIFQFNHSHHARVGHLLKSRARENVIQYNFITDANDGTSSYVVNLPNGGRGVLIGNIIYQGPHARNKTMIAYGEEGIRHRNSSLTLINNTLINRRRGGIFISVRKTPPAFQLTARNNIFAGGGQITNAAKHVMSGNFSEGAPLFTNPVQFNFQLQPTSPCIDKGKAVNQPLRPAWEYVHPRSKRKRQTVANIDIGAYESTPNTTSE